MPLPSKPSLRSGASPNQQSQLDLLKTTFLCCDVDAQGYVDRSELMHRLKQEPDLTQNADSIIASCLPTRLGRLSYGEFLNALKKLSLDVGPATPPKSQSQDRGSPIFDSTPSRPRVPRNTPRLSGRAISSDSRRLLTELRGHIETRFGVANFQEAFLSFDRDRSGYISLDEMERILAARSIRMTAAHRTALQELCGGGDASADARIDYVTFTSLFGGDSRANVGNFPWSRDPPLRPKTPLSKRRPSPVVKTDFGREQLVKYLRQQMEQRWGPANFRETFLSYDRDRSGFIDLRELQQILSVNNIRISLDSLADICGVAADASGEYGRISFRGLVDLLTGVPSGNSPSSPPSQPGPVTDNRPHNVSPPQVARAHAELNQPQTTSLQRPSSPEQIPMDFGREQLVKYLRQQMEQRWGPANFRETFLSYDRDHSGFIDLCELQQILSVNNIRISLDTLADICGVAADASGEYGRISFRGLVDLLTGVPSGDSSSHPDGVPRSDSTLNARHAHPDPVMDDASRQTPTQPQPEADIVNPHMHHHDYEQREMSASQRSRPQDVPLPRTYVEEQQSKVKTLSPDSRSLCITLRGSPFLTSRCML